MKWITQLGKSAFPTFSMMASFCVIFGLLAVTGGNAIAGPPVWGYDFGDDFDDLYVDNQKNRWVLDADTGYAYHENLKQGTRNDISIASFLEAWYDATGVAPVRAKLYATYGYEGCGSTTWLTGSGFDTRFVSYEDGLVISFEATGLGESGEVAYAIQGQNDERDWTGGHTQVRAFQIQQLYGEVHPDQPLVSPWYQLLWDTALDVSIGSITEVGATDTRMILGGTVDAEGFNYTNCGANSLVWPNTTIRWIVDTLDIVY